MKWFLCALCCLTEGLSVLRAQIMPDSSVQICAYWTPGDKYAYEAREEKFKIDDQGDTTLVYRQRERRVFEILSQTKDRYKIRLTYGDYMTTDKEDQLVHDAIVSATGPCVVEFETDETGSLLGIANLETLVAQAEASVEPAVRVMWETIPSAERKNFPKKNFRKYMARTLSDPSVVINAVNDDLGRMFFFHGARLDSTQVIQMDLGQRGIQVETLEMFPAYKRQKSYLLAGILIDDISNYALLYNVHAIKKNGELHRGMDGFCQEKNMVQVPLTVLSEWERIECVDHEIFIVENPSVFALICGEKSCMCMNGQPRLAGLLVLELLAKSGTKVYYSGDLDPEGILIAQKLSQYYRGTFCYWHMTPFDYEQCRSKEILSEKRKKMLQKITDERLLPVVDAVTKYGVAGYQESIGLNQISI